MTQDEARHEIQRRHGMFTFADVVDGRCVVGVMLDTVRGPAPIIYGTGATWEEALAADSARTRRKQEDFEQARLDAIRAAVAAPRMRNLAMAVCVAFLGAVIVLNVLAFIAMVGK